MLIENKYRDIDMKIPFKSLNDAVLELLLKDDKCKKHAYEIMGPNFELFREILPNEVFDVIRALVKRPDFKSPMKDSTKKYLLDRLQNKLDGEIIAIKDHNREKSL